jgi:hypothetical protein
MRELRSEEVGDRRVRLLVDPDGRRTVTIEVWAGAWEDISLRSDKGWRCTRPACATVCV